MSETRKAPKPARLVVHKDNRGSTLRRDCGCVRVQRGQTVRTKLCDEHGRLAAAQLEARHE